MMIARQNVRVTGIQASMHLGLIECSNVRNMPSLEKLSNLTRLKLPFTPVQSIPGGDLFPFCEIAEG